MGKIILTEQAAPSTPSANTVALYPKAGGGLYKMDDAGTETLLGDAPHFGASSELTIASGVITATGPGWYTVDSEGDAASDALDKIEGLSAGDQVVISAEDGARVITVTRGAYLKLQHNFRLDNIYKTMTLMCIGSDVCVEITRSANQA